MKMGGFRKVSGGYKKQISTETFMFIPDMCAESFDEITGTVEMYKPVYEERKETGEAVVGENFYRYENQKPQTSADFQADFSHDGTHYILKPLRADLTLSGRGIKRCGNWFYATERAYEKIKAQYKILRELSFD